MEFPGEFEVEVSRPGTPDARWRQHQRAESAARGPRLAGDGHLVRASGAAALAATERPEFLAYRAETARAASTALLSRPPLARLAACHGHGRSEGATPTIRRRPSS